MSCWSVRAEPAACPGFAGALVLLHAALAVLPWAAGCTPTLAAALAAVALGTLPHTLAAVPGQRSRLKSIAGDGRAWRVRGAGGMWQAAELRRGCRVLGPIVLLELAVAGRRLDWWVPRYALPADDFRRLKVAALAAGAGARRADC